MLVMLNAVSVPKQCFQLLPSVNKTQYQCGWWFSNTCDRFEVSHKNASVCCEHYVENDDGHTCSAVCPKACQTEACVLDGRRVPVRRDTPCPHVKKTLTSVSLIHAQKATTVTIQSARTCVNLFLHRDAVN
ncbi:uncharacterized protein LOC135472222 [Liolophura sinensis]|uniref:uncharacterized protein LOC135472222 n=1 Tax=Liolophura sinensis TaxID=3198878 RepID=UPI003158B94C